jgi:hypothetical protein
MWTFPRLISNFYSLILKKPIQPVMEIFNLPGGPGGPGLVPPGGPKINKIKINHSGISMRL